MANAGDLPAILDPTFYIGAVVNGQGPVWPSRLGTKGQTWPTDTTKGWFRAKGLGNGVRVAIQDPQANLQTSDLGITGQVSTGAHGILVTSQLHHVKLQFFEWFTKARKKALSATGGTSEVRTLTVTGTATATGNALITLNGDTYVVAITSGDTATAAATKIRLASNYSPTTVTNDWTITGATGDVIYTSTSAGLRSGTFSASLPAGLSGSFATTTPGVNPTYAAGSTYAYNPTGSRGAVIRFMVGVEGIAEAGSLQDKETLVRFVAHNINHGGTTTLPFDSSGTDARFSLNLSGQCLPRSIGYTELAGTGFDPSDLDEDGRATWWVAKTY